MPRKLIVALLAGGDRRSIGRSNRVAAMVSRNHDRFPELMAGLWSADLLVRIRAADAAEKVTRKFPKLLAPHKKELLGLMAEASEPELRWHLAAIVPRLPLEPRERLLVVSRFHRYLQDDSSIVKTFALQGMAELARFHPPLEPSVKETLREAARTGTAAMKARSRRLLRGLERD